MEQVNIAASFLESVSRNRVAGWLDILSLSLKMDRTQLNMSCIQSTPAVWACCSRRIAPRPILVTVFLCIIVERSLNMRSLSLCTVSLGLRVDVLDLPPIMR